jgi:hypothetical protein
MRFIFCFKAGNSFKLNKKYDYVLAVYPAESQMSRLPVSQEARLSRNKTITFRQPVSLENQHGGRLRPEMGIILRG